MSHIEKPKRAGYAAITDDTSVRVAGHEATRLLAIKDGRKKRYVEGYVD